MADSVDSRLEPFLRSARDYLRRAMGAELDGSETSLAFVDHYLLSQRPPADAPIASPVLNLLASALGVYFGEVCRAHLPGGGQWQMIGDDPRTYRLQLEASGVAFSPVAMVVTALFGDEVEGWDATVRPPDKWRTMLERVLAESAPVDQDYYYSLTGRFESLGRIGDLIADFERLTQPPAPAEADSDDPGPN